MNKTVILATLALSCAPAIMAEDGEPVENRAHYSTNPGGAVGKYATITIDGNCSDWDESMIIATGGANDQCNAFKGAHENCVLDMYALYGAWDDTNLYIAWQMVNTADIWAREGDGPLSDGGRVLDVPLALALSVDPNTVTLTGKNTSGQGLWGGKSSMGYEFQVHTDYLLLMSGKPGLGEPAMFKAADAQGNSSYDAQHCLNFAANGIDYKMAEDFQPSHLWRMKLASPTLDDIYDETTYENLLSAEYAGKAHSKSYDSFYEIKIPLRLLGIDRAWLEANGIGCRLLATRGESAIDCLPHDPSMLDNVMGDYGADPSTSHEKDDIDIITYRHADIGRVRDIASIDPVDPVDPTDPTDPSQPPLTTQDPGDPSDNIWVAYFDNSVASWGSVNVWCWDGGNNAVSFNGSSWPGNAIQQDAETGYFKYTLSNPTLAGRPMIIFSNNGTPKTGDEELKHQGVYNAAGFTGKYLDSAIQAVGTDDAAAEPVYYTLQGVRVATPTASGLYIRRQGTTTTKILVK